MAKFIIINGKEGSGAINIDLVFSISKEKEDDKWVIILNSAFSNNSKIGFSSEKKRDKAFDLIIGKDK